MSSPAPLERRLFDYASAATYLGVSIRKMKELGGPNGSIVRVTIGNKTLFDKADLDSFVDRLKAAS